MIFLRPIKIPVESVSLSNISRLVSDSELSSFSFECIANTLTDVDSGGNDDGREERDDGRDGVVEADLSDLAQLVLLELLPPLLVERVEKSGFPKTKDSLMSRNQFESNPIKFRVL